jgi:uncharacterized protein (DUF302 family)
MINKITVEHVTFTTDRGFEAVVRLFEEQVGSIEGRGFSSIIDSSTTQADFEERVQEIIGPSGFTRFLTVDHGAWVSKQGRPTKFVMYTLGNPLIAISMIKHHVEAGLDVPVRLAIYEDEEGFTKVVFNKPSSLMSSLNNEALEQAATKLDDKMIALAEVITGVKV